MTSERKDAGTRSDGADRAAPQDESLKKHGDILDPVIPRGADQKADDASRVSEGDRAARGTPAR